MNRYPAWKYILILIVLIVGVLYAAPNLYFDDPALQIAGNRHVSVNDETLKRIESTLKDSGIQYKSAAIDEKGALVRFNNEQDRQTAKASLQDMLGPNYVVALNYARTTPEFLKAINALPMYMGLDLRGGLHFLIEIDMESAFQQQLERYKNDIFDYFKDNREKKLRARSMLIKDHAIELKYKDAAKRDEVLGLIRHHISDLRYTTFENGQNYYIKAEIKEAKLDEHRSNTISQIITVLKKRIDDKYQGLMEPVIVRQGDSRIVAEFPGIQNSEELMDVLTAAASLEFRMEHTGYTIEDAKAGKAIGATLYRMRDSGREVLLKNKIIITGEDIVHATATSDQNGQPAVAVTLNSTGANIMKDNTRKNLGKRMGVVFIEFEKSVEKNKEGKMVPVKKERKEVISLATIQGLFSKNFIITGLSRDESTKLALLLRAGALAAPIEIVEERTVGPSLGAENITKGIESVVIGFFLVVILMLLWYRGFGLVANVALVANLILIIAILSMFQATLTLPGIAGIVLTVGMAVDANVLIFERIREELRIGNTPQASINAGYEKAFSTIFDANITTLIAAIVLFIFGTGPVKGFATTLSIGIATSMFTAIMGTRAIINLIVGTRKLTKLSI